MPSGRPWWGLLDKLLKIRNCKVIVKSESVVFVGFLAFVVPFEILDHHRFACAHFGP